MLILKRILILSTKRSRPRRNWRQLENWVKVWYTSINTKASANKCQLSHRQYCMRHIKIFVRNSRTINPIFGGRVQICITLHILPLRSGKNKRRLWLDFSFFLFQFFYFFYFFLFFMSSIFYRNCTFSFKEDVKERACQILPPNHVLNQLASQITSRIMILCNCQLVYNSIVIIKILFNATNSQSHSTKKHPLKKMWHHGTGWMV